MFPSMRRDTNAGWSNRLCCAFLRIVVMLVLGFVGLGVYLASGGSDTLDDALLLLVLGSMMGYFAQVFGDFTGAYSRVGVLNQVIYLYSMLFLPAAGFFIVSRLVVGSYAEAGASSVASFIFLALYCAARTARRGRDAAAAPAAAAGGGAVAAAA